MEMSEPKSLFECEELSLYCEFYGVTPKNVKEDIDLALYINEKRAVLDQLISGYRQMGALNQTFCEKFPGCQCCED